jgi:hypothetical protein
MPVPRFVGRARELGLLGEHLEAVREGHGRLVSLRGRRQVGKSRLVSELLARTDVPHLFFTGSLQTTLEADLRRFADDAVREGTMPRLAELEGVRFESWETALRTVGALLDRPAALVLDEFPWLVRNDPGLEGTIQKLWDRALEAKPLLLLLVGSDLSMMQTLTEHGRPLFGRARELVLRPFHPGETAEMLEGTPATEVVDTQLVTGGYPRLVEERRRAASTRRFVEHQLRDENTDLVVVAQRVLEAEFPSHIQAREILDAIGSGERTHSAIAQRTGFSPSVLSRGLDALIDKGLVARDLPLSLRRSRESRYRVSDAYLRFWLRLVEPAIPDIARGRPDLALRRVREGWTTFRGKAVEPIVRAALTRRARDDRRLGGAGVVGGYWTRKGDLEIDLVGLDREDKPKRVTFVGSVKWRATAPFGPRDLRALAQARRHVPGAAEARLVAVTNSGMASGTEPDAIYGPEEIVAAYRSSDG